MGLCGSEASVQRASSGVRLASCVVNISRRDALQSVLCTVAIDPLIVIAYIRVLGVKMRIFAYQLYDVI